MQPRTCLLSAFTLGTAMSFGAAAVLPLTVRAETPKEGTDSFTNTWVVTGPSPIKVGDRTAATYELSGVHRNDKTGANMGLRCLGMFEIPGPHRDHGACIFVDKEGDQIMMTYEGNGPTSGTETWVAGTGKFAGISGTGEYTRLQSGLKAGDNVSRGVVTEKIHWKLP